MQTKDYFWTKTGKADFQLLSVTDTHRIYLISITGRLSSQILDSHWPIARNHQFFIKNRISKILEIFEFSISTTYAYRWRDNDSSWKEMIPNDSVRGSDITVLSRYHFSQELNGSRRCQNRHFEPKIHSKKFVASEIRTRNKIMAGFLIRTINVVYLERIFEKLLQKISRNFFKCSWSLKFLVTKYPLWNDSESFQYS